MPLPKIVGEKKREIKEIEPPSNYRFHEWSGEDKKVDVFINEKAMDKIMEHCNAYADQRLEVLGFLIGDVCKWNGRTYTIIKDIVTTELDSTSVTVRFEREGFEKLFEKLDDLGYDYVIVGWYHSHPGHTCFMSSTDIETQRKMFKEQYHVAIVVDPINSEFKGFKLYGTSYKEILVGIYSPAIVEIRKIDEEKKKLEEDKKYILKSTKELEEGRKEVKKKETLVAEKESTLRSKEKNLKSKEELLSKKEIELLNKKEFFERIIRNLNNLQEKVVNQKYDLFDIDMYNIMFSIAEEYRRVGDFKSADKMYEKAFKLYAGNTKMWYNWGITKREIGENDGAITCFQNCIALVESEAFRRPPDEAYKLSLYELCKHYANTTPINLKKLLKKLVRLLSIDENFLEIVKRDVAFKNFEITKSEDNKKIKIKQLQR